MACVGRAPHDARSLRCVKPDPSVATTPYEPTLALGGSIGTSKASTNSTAWVI